MRSTGRWFRVVSDALVVILLLGLIAISLGVQSKLEVVGFEQQEIPEEEEVQTLTASWTGTDGIDVNVTTTREEGEETTAFHQRHETVVNLQKSAHPPSP